MCFAPSGDALLAHSDASHGDEVKIRPSSQGYVFFLTRTHLLWQAKLQRLVSLSTFEAELVAKSDTPREVVSLLELLRGLGITQSGLVLYDDSRKMVHLTNDPAMKTCTMRHIDIRHHYAREHVQDGLTKIKWIPTEQIAADGFKKALAGLPFERSIRLLGLADM